MTASAHLQGRVEALLRRNDVLFQLSDDGAFVAAFGGDGIPPLVVRLTVSEGPALSFKAFLVCLYTADWAPCLYVQLNRWHCRERWPRGFVVFDEPSSSSAIELAVFADHHVPLSPSVSDGQLDLWLWSFVAAADDLLTTVYLAAPEEADPLPMPSAAELDRWFQAE